MPEMKTRFPYNTVPLKSGGFAGSGGLAPAARNIFFTGLSAVPCARAATGADTTAAAAATAGAFFRNALRLRVVLCSPAAFDFGIIYLLTRGPRISGAFQGCFLARRSAGRTR